VRKVWQNGIGQMPFWQQCTSSSARGWAAACVLAVVCAGIATAAEFAFSFLFGPTLPFAAYLPAILVAALLGGALAGTFTTLISVVVVWWVFIPPFYEFGILDAKQSVNVALFALSAFGIVWAAYRYRQTAAQPMQRD
jgi:K+-sensing histidine kinase KdpD